MTDAQTPDPATRRNPLPSALFSLVLRNFLFTRRTGIKPAFWEFFQIAGVKGRSDGLRAGAGRKRRPRTSTTSSPTETGFRGPSPDVGKATQFQPGNRANPSGRPKRKPVTDAYSARLDQKMSEYFAPDELAKIPERLRESTVADFVAHSIIEEVIVGKNKVQAAKEITDRVEGKVPLPLMGVNDAPIDITIVSKMARPKRGNAGRVPNPGSRKPNGDH